MSALLFYKRGLTKSRTKEFLKVASLLDLACFLEFSSCFLELDAWKPEQSCTKLFTA